MNIIEYIRQQAVESLFDMNSFSQCYPIWKEKIESILGSNPTYSKINSLGDNLAEVFKGTRQDGRSQADVSGGGNAWEGLVCWYLNLNLIGSRAELEIDEGKIIFSSREVRFENKTWMLSGKTEKTLYQLLALVN